MSRVDDTTRRCADCGGIFPLANFYPRKRSPGWDCYCKKCRHAYNVQWVRDKRVRVREQQMKEAVHE